MSLMFTIGGTLGLFLLLGIPPAGRLRVGRRPDATQSMTSWRPRDRLVRPRRALLGVTSAIAGWFGAWLLFGNGLGSATAAVLAAAIPAHSAATLRRRRMWSARQAWPRLLSEIRVLVTSRGQSIPSALFAAGASAPIEMRGAFLSAARTWALSTDFEVALAVLRGALADPTADAVCETLLAAHRIGGVDLDTRLRALAEAAQVEAAERQDARARQAGARFARSFVLVVPAFMAVIGLGIGRGREAYQNPSGQLLVALSFGAVAGCWFWAGRIMAVPQRRRVFCE